MKQLPISERLIISLYDYTGQWAQPYIDAGYPVMLWDKKVEGDILEGFSYLIMQIEETGLKPYGLIAAPPCTDFASSGARWFEEKDKPTPGYEPFANTTELSEALTLIVLEYKEYYKDSLNFWVMENPVGRIERLVPEIKPYRKMSFHPCDYGDPYTKQTILWGQFNANLQGQGALNLFGSLMNKVPGGPKQAERRSATPKGFSKAFFQANQ